MQNLKKPNPLNNRKIIADSGPIVVLLCCYEKDGTFNPEKARKLFSHTKDFDFYNVSGEELIKKMGRNSIIITPHVLAEISGHLIKEHFQLSEIFHDKNPIFRLLTSGKTDEKHISLIDILKKIQEKGNIDYGITDSGLISITLSVKGFLLTEDGPLEKLAKKLGVKVITPRRLMYGEIPLN